MEYIELGKNYPYFDAMKWVISATTKKKNMNMMYRTDCVQIRGESIVGTDGNRIHCLDAVHPYQDGVYQVVTNQKNKLGLTCKRMLSFLNGRRFFRLMMQLHLIFGLGRMMYMYLMLKLYVP